MSLLEQTGSFKGDILSTSRGEIIFQSFAQNFCFLPYPSMLQLLCKRGDDLLSLGDNVEEAIEVYARRILAAGSECGNITF